MGQPAPDEHHCRTGRGGQQDQSGDVAVDLFGGQQRREQLPDEQPTEQGHRKWLDQPVHKQRHADAFDVLPHFMERAEVHLDQHRNDHHPDQ